MQPRLTGSRFHALYDKVYRMDVLQEAWRRVRSNQGAAGLDKQTLQDIENMGVYSFLLSCQQSLNEGNYHPQPVRRKYIPKKDGKIYMFQNKLFIRLITIVEYVSQK